MRVLGGKCYRGTKREQRRERLNITRPTTVSVFINIGGAANRKGKGSRSKELGA
jgi:hypothetical protein